MMKIRMTIAGTKTTIVDVGKARRKWMLDWLKEGELDMGHGYRLDQQRR